MICPLLSNHEAVRVLVEDNIRGRGPPETGLGEPPPLQLSGVNVLRVAAARGGAATILGSTLKEYIHKISNVPMS